MICAFLTAAFRGIFGAMVAGAGGSLIVNWFRGNIVINETTDFTWGVVVFFVFCIAMIFTGAYNAYNCADSIDYYFENGRKKGGW